MHGVDICTVHGWSIIWFNWRRLVWVNSCNCNVSSIDHIVSGVAINILAVGAARFFNILAFDSMLCEFNCLSRVEGEIGKFNFPYLSGGNIGDNETTSLFANIENADIFWFLTSPLCYLALHQTFLISQYLHF